MMTKRLKVKDREDRKSRDTGGNQKNYTRRENKEEEGGREVKWERRKRRDGNKWVRCMLQCQRIWKQEIKNIGRVRVVDTGVKG